MRPVKPLEQKKKNPWSVQMKSKTKTNLISGQCVVMLKTGALGQSCY